MWGMHDGMSWWMLIGGITIAFFWAVVILDVTGLIAWQSHGGSDANGDAFEAARRRYARGEIGRDEFLRISKDLANAGHS